MAGLPVLPVQLPSSLVGVTNGKLLPSQVEAIGPSGWLHHRAARCWRAFKLAGEGALGRPLTWTYGGTYRSYEQQEQLFRSRYTPTPTLLQKLRSTNRKVWNGQTWYLVSGAMAAVPGTSNHGLGLAIDVAYGDSPARATSVDARFTAWAVAHAHEFGFSFEAQSEPWHIRLVAGDAVPRAVLDIEAFFAPPSPPLPPPPPPPVEIPRFDPANGQWSLYPLVPHEQRPVLNLGSGLDPASPDRDWVLYVQWVIKLKTRFGEWTDTGGVFNDNTRTIVAALQADPLIHQYPDGIIGADDWWWVDGLGRPQ